jgi:hypothetical protein
MTVSVRTKGHGRTQSFLSRTDTTPDHSLSSESSRSCRKGVNARTNSIRALIGVRENSRDDESR